MKSLLVVLAIAAFALSCTKDRLPGAPSSKANCLLCAIDTDLVSTTQEAQEDTLEDDPAPEDVDADSLSALPDSLAFNIELIFEDGFPQWEIDLIQDAKRHWEKQFHDIPDYTVKHGLYVAEHYIAAGEVIDDIHIY